MRVLFALPGLHRTHRGAEVAFQSIASELARAGDSVVLFGSGAARSGTSYAFEHVASVSRENFERWPHVPCIRSEYAYEELTYVPGLLRRFRPSHFDVTLTCSYPFTNWALRAARLGRSQPAHVFVTQNGDWAPHETKSEYRLFSCDGLVCINQTHYERNKDRWRSVLIPNGVDPGIFSPGDGDRRAFGLPSSPPVFLIVSALQPSKRVVQGIRAVAQIEESFLVVAGDGPLRAEVDHVGADLMPGRFLRVSVAHSRMPELYRCADVFLHPALEESFPHAFAEALVTGVPIVAHDFEVTRWVFQDHAELVDAGEHEALVAGLRAALESGSGEASERVAFGVRNYAWSELARRYRAFLAEIIAGRGDGQERRSAAVRSRDEPTTDR